MKFPSLSRYPSRLYGRHPRLVKACVLVLAASFLVLVGESIAPQDFPSGKIVTISKNSGLSGAADTLRKANVIRSAFVFKAAVVLMGGRKHISAGDYLFEGPESVVRVAYRTIHGEDDLPIVRVTLPEGGSSSDYAKILGKVIPGFATSTFFALARPKEGYLYPDTYFFKINVTPETVFDTLRDTFDLKLRSIQPKMNSSSHSAYDTIVMASIVEKEGLTSADRRIIAGILWKRLAAGMPLQVDAPFVYLLGKASAELTVRDLATTSPYNLYKYKGLTPTPIGNPSTAAIIDTIEASTTPYWFFLSDNKGIMHYAATHDQHVANIQKYIP